MGCWSESCALSGLEVMLGEKDVYVALIQPNKYRDTALWEIVVPPIKGTYDDYGGINLTEDAVLFDLHKGDNWRPWNDDRGQPIYINGLVFDSLPQLEREFDWKGKTLEDAFQVHIEELKEKQLDVDALIKVSKHTAIVDQFIDLLFSVTNSIIVNGSALYKKNDPNFWKFYKRAYMLQYAQFELRKLCVPKIGGPQHNGERALKQFYTTVNNILDARIEEFNEDEE